MRLSRVRISTALAMLARAQPDGIHPPCLIPPAPSHSAYSALSIKTAPSTGFAQYGAISRKPSVA
jgi:hypothetical protein